MHLFNGGVMIFRDRVDAGRRLAARLEEYRLERPLILALPRGGVPVAFEVSRGLGAELDVLMVRRIDVPHVPARSVGAIAEGDGLYLRPEALRELGVSDAEAAVLAERQLPELTRSLHTYRSDHPPPKLAGRSVILVDDGVATGSTARAAARAVRKRGAAKVILASPVVARPIAAELEAEVDAIVALESPPAVAAIDEWYERFEEVSDDEVVTRLRRAPALRVPVGEGSDLWDGEWVGGGRGDGPPPANDMVSHGSIAPKPGAAQYALEEHAELAIRIGAPTLAMLFREAGRALSEVMGRGGGSSLPVDYEEAATVTAPDREALLVGWLNELVYRAEVSHFLPKEFSIEQLSDQRLEAVVRGARVERFVNPVKAATFHGLSISGGSQGFRATIVLDV